MTRSVPGHFMRARRGRAQVKMGECGGHFEASAANEGLTTPTGAVRARRGRAQVKMGECGGHFWAPAIK
jgi:hypothetical protein